MRGFLNASNAPLRESNVVCPKSNPCAEARRPSLIYLSIKRCLDICVGACGLVVTSPVILIAGLAIKLDSPGPVLYRGRRLGRNGIEFTLFKLRSMVVGSDLLQRSVGRADPGVTRVGKILRRYKLDELPQLFNVIRGDMSVVGPRPELPRYAHVFAGDYQRILNVRPGLTDPATVEFAQVADVLGAKDPDRAYEEHVLPRKNVLRLQYVARQSLAADLGILAKTLGVLVRSFLSPPRSKKERTK